MKLDCRCTFVGYCPAIKHSCFWWCPANKFLYGNLISGNMHLYMQWRKKMFLDGGADLPKEPRRYCGILFLILRVWFFSGDGGAGAPPAPPLLTPVTCTCVGHCPANMIASSKVDNPNGLKVQSCYQLMCRILSS